ncbi:MAG: class I SAM-dependent DNA methyltransferase [Christensenellaceae bacterium]
MGNSQNQIDKIWDDMYSYGMANPLVVIEQLTYLFFIRSLDMNEELNEKTDEMFPGTSSERIFAQDEHGQALRWNKFKILPAEQMFELIRDQVFPFIKGENTVVILDDGTKHTIEGMKISKKSSYGNHMRNANFGLPSPLITEKVVTAIDTLPLKENDLKGDLYEYMISKIQSSGRIGQFRTPRHIIEMMVDLIDPQITDTIADPACGTGGFLIVSGHYVREHNKEAIRKNTNKAREHYQSEMFTGYDTDQTMLRITAMNTILHNMDNATIKFNDSLSKDNEDTEKYSVILANPPFKGSLDHESVAPSLTAVTDTRKTELLFLALFIRMLKVGGKCACIVPDGVLFGTSKAHMDIRKELVEKHKLQAVISMPSGVFKPYAGVSTAVLVFTKTGKGGTDKVWFYDMKSDGFTLDDKRTKIEIGGDIEDIVERYKHLGAEESRTRKEQSFLVPVQEIIDKKYDLSLNRYKESDYQDEVYDHPSVTIAKVKALEADIQTGLDELEAMFE